MSKSSSKEKFKFKKHMSIGAMDAYEDENLLHNCFVDTGDLDILLNTNDSKCIVVARTGAGKSALIETIKLREENTITLQPEELSLNYIANSNVIRFFEKIGIKLDIFYQLLWRHVLAVELIKYKFDIKNEDNRKSFIERISTIFTRDKSKEDAVNYLMNWGDKFWLETDKRIKELTTKLEDELSASADFSGHGISLTASGSEKMSSEIKADVVQRAQNVVNNVQIQKLNKVINLLADDVFTDRQQKYYILIDKLDDDWVDDELRYRLIRALIETVKTFKRIVPVKIIISLRSDLISRVFEKTRDSGFQEEKYEDYMLRLKWSKDDLHGLLDKRISYVLAEKYTSSNVLFNTVFTSKPKGKKPIDYILDRTFLRPRDAISFVNLCIDSAYGKHEINTESIKHAETIYSKKRFTALCYEWFADYPCLEQYTLIIKGLNNGFKHSDITDENIDELSLMLSVDDKHKNDPIKLMAIKMFEKGGPSKAVLRNNILSIFYVVGIIGVKKASHTNVCWSQYDEPIVSESEVKNSTHFEIHPMLHNVLGIKSNHKK